MKHIYSYCVLLGFVALFCNPSFAGIASKKPNVNVHFQKSQPAKNLISANKTSKANSLTSGNLQVNDIITPSIAPNYEGPIKIKSTQTYNTKGASFNTINFDDNAVNNGQYNIPPDPCAASGTGHIVLMVNTSIEWYTKAGVKQNSQSLKSFFGSNTSTFDPKVLYDQYEDRFVVVALEKYSGRSYTYLAVSDDGDPNGTWHATSFDVTQQVDYNTTDGVDTLGWIDYPGFAVDDKAVYITGNYFPFLGSGNRGSRLLIIDKGVSGGFYDGAAASWSINDPVLSSGALAVAVTLQPAHMFGNVPASMGTFIVGYSGLSNGVDEFLQIIRVDDPLSTPTYDLQHINTGNIADFSSFPDAPQYGTSDSIETNDRRALNAVWRENALWMTAVEVPYSGVNANQTTAYWWKMDTQTLSALTLSAHGEVGAEDLGASTFTYFPSIAINTSGDALIGFSASSHNLYAGAYFAIVPNGSTTVGTTGLVKEGEDSYNRRFSGTRNRWGDYSSVSIDPSDQSFWIFNEYAMSRGTILIDYPTQDGRWATAIKNVSMADPLVEAPTSITASNPTLTTIDLNWSGPTTEYRVLRKTTETSSSPTDGDIVFDGTGSSVTDGSLTGNTVYFYTVYGKIGTEYSAGNQKTVIATVSPDPNNYGAIGFLANETGLKSLGNTGASINFNSGSLTDGVLGCIVEANLGSDQLPGTIQYLSQDKFWTIVNVGLSGFSYDITLDLSPISGITNFNTLRIVKRESAGFPWTDLAEEGYTHNYADPLITVSGLSSFSTIGVGSVGDNPLPVELSSFSGISTQSGVKLNWITQSETNNEGFILLRNGFEIASYLNTDALSGQGTVSGSTHYSFIDSEVELGEIYTYTLRSVDYSGITHDYTQSVTVEVTEFISSLVYSYALAQNYPNPFNPSTTISFTMKQASMATLKVYDMIGRKVFEKQIEASIGKNSVTFNAQNLTTGIYFYQLSTEGFSKTLKMMLVK